MKNLSFKISSNLKNIIGRELITDKIIAIFELVKNSYDAGATRVDIFFDNIYQDSSSIRIVDNGCGMNKDDLENKWLFVAYSEKKHRLTQPHIDNVITHQRIYAGAKGVGRFACDRLGKHLELKSRMKDALISEFLHVNWDKFEQDDTEEFVKIPVEYKQTNDQAQQGTELHITELRESWDRIQIMYLKKALAKLISPHAGVETNLSEDVFEIYIFCKEEEENDEKEQKEQNKIIGKINNYIFDELNLKTTKILVQISEDGNKTTTSMNDRGTPLFTIEQKNKHPYLKNIHAEIYYLNRSAKQKFGKIMGVAPIQFGSVFIYKNGFRIMPYGEPGYDVFQMDKRQAQGYKRFLGTREIMGKINIIGKNTDFRETSSRDGGFVRTPAYDELEKFYMTHVHRVLEKYIVNIIKWGGLSPKHPEEIHPQDVVRELVKYMVDYKKTGDILSITPNTKLLNIIHKQQDHSTSDIIEEFHSYLPEIMDPELETFANKLIKQNQTLEKENSELAKQHNQASEKLEETSEKLEQKEKEFNIVKKQAHFLKALKTPTHNNTIESLHLINNIAHTINNNTKHILKILKKENIINKKLNEQVFTIHRLSKEINTLYNFVFSADYDITKKIQTVHIYDYLSQYITDFYMPKIGNLLKIQFPIEKKFDYHLEINLIKFNMMIENIINNSIKAHAKNIFIDFLEIDGFIEISFIDDGNGLDKSITNPNDIFELGFTTTDGTGIGLASAKKTLEDINGTIEVENREKGFAIKMRIKYGN